MGRYPAAGLPTASVVTPTANHEEEERDDAPTPMRDTYRVAWREMEKVTGASMQIKPKCACSLGQTPFDAMTPGLVGRGVGRPSDVRLSSLRNSNVSSIFSNMKLGLAKD